MKHQFRDKAFELLAFNKKENRGVVLLLIILVAASLFVRIYNKNSGNGVLGGCSDTIMIKSGVEENISPLDTTFRPERINDNNRWLWR